MRSRLQRLAQQPGITMQAIAREAGISRSYVEKMLYGERPVTESALAAAERVALQLKRELEEVLGDRRQERVKH